VGEENRRSKPTAQAELNSQLTPEQLVNDNRDRIKLAFSYKEKIGNLTFGQFIADEWTPEDCFHLKVGVQAAKCSGGALSADVSVLLGIYLTKPFSAFEVNFLSSPLNQEWSLIKKGERGSFPMIDILTRQRHLRLAPAGEIL
jgi:hypothetical protein